MKRLFCLFFLIFSFQGFAQTSGNLSVSVATSSAGGNFAPKHIMAIWIEDSTGNFIKTLLAYADRRIKYLNTWEESTGAQGTMYNKTDAISGATRTSHGTRNCAWDGTDYNKSAVPDGKYFVCLELTDKHETGNYSKFSFVKGESNSLSPSNVPSFSSVSINWEASVTVDATVFPFKNNVTIFPNPGNGIFKISGESIEHIEVCSISGKLIFKQNYSNQIDLSDLKAGIYLVKIKSGDNWHIEKIVKE